jgi:hypothetical protein
MGKKRISKKIGFLMHEEGLSANQAAGKAYGMARHGSMGGAAKRAAGRRPAKHKMPWSTHEMHEGPCGLIGARPEKY